MRPILRESDAAPCRGARTQLATQALFAGALRSLHQIDAELVRDVADDQE
jgi:hypothetical protein